ncbi:MAG: hypothetical protein AAFN43_06595, partial [Pseudomonadota bacterium]
GFTAFDVDSPGLASATITISDGFVSGEDVLALGSTTGLSASYSSTTGVLTLTGAGSVADYVSAIQGITFQNTGSATSDTTREITYELNDGMDSSAPVTSTIDVMGSGGGMLTFSIAPPQDGGLPIDTGGKGGIALKSLSAFEPAEPAPETVTDMAGLFEDDGSGFIPGLEETNPNEAGAGVGQGGAGLPDTGGSQPGFEMDAGSIDPGSIGATPVDDGLAIQSQMQVTG